MTIARRVIPIIRMTPAGAPAGAFVRGGMEIPHLEAIARYHEADGADEIWLRLTEPDERGAAALFDPVKAVRDRVNIPVVAWGAIRSSADARLLVGLGADRVVIDEADAVIDDVTSAVLDIANAVGRPSVSVAMVTRRRVRDLEGWASKRAVAWELCEQDGTPRERDAVALAQAVSAAGAGELIVVPWLQGFSTGDGTGHDPELVDRLLALIPGQVVSVGQDHEPADLAPALLMGADGVASETLYAGGAHSVASVKRTLAEFGIPLRPGSPPYAQGD